MIYNQFDIVVVPFPFTASDETKKRPAIILSSNKNFNQPAGHSILAMITSARNESWPLDVTITNLIEAGLPKASVIRMKFFTLDHRFIIKKIGRLETHDQARLQKSMHLIFGELIPIQ